jgi:CubicO group peptidase (beta-lactamase class C family)
MAEKIKISPDLIGGDVDEGYGKVADAFRRNLDSGKEVGAAVAIYRDGRKVVDLWGGYRNGTTRAPWERDTIVTVFSTTKGVAALTVAVAASRGLIDYDAKGGRLLARVRAGGQGRRHGQAAARPPGRAARHQAAAHPRRHRRP